MTTQPGWYDDGSGNTRWWDGSGWTEKLREVEASPASTEASYRGTEQALWVVFHWVGTGYAALLALISVPGVGQNAGQAVAAIAGLLATIAGSLMATSLARRRLPLHDFVRGTSTSRSVTGAWVLIIGGYLVAIVVSGLFHLAEGVGGTLGRTLDDGILATFLGLGTLLAIVGPGYSEYREARSRQQH